MTEKSNAKTAPKSRKTVAQSPPKKAPETTALPPSTGGSYEVNENGEYVKVSHFTDENNTED